VLDSSLPGQEQWWPTRKDPRNPAIDRHFEPTVMARELARSVEVLAAAIDNIPSDQLDQEALDRLMASVNASLAELRRIRRQLKAQPVF
jgi:hypothetical protein